MYFVLGQSYIRVYCDTDSQNGKLCRRQVSGYDLCHINVAHMH